MIKIRSKLSFEDSVKILEENMEKKSMQIFYRADHRKNALESGLQLDDALVFYFGDPKVGTILMQDNPEISFELPLKIAIYKERDSIYFGYRNPEEYGSEYELDDKSKEILKKMSALYENLLEGLK